MGDRPPPLTLQPSHPVFTLRRFLERFAWLQTSIGLLGNLSFFVGSILFLWESSQLVGTWLFIVGSLGMLLGSLGSAVLRIEQDNGD